jgi:hypothetical protein
MVSAGCRQRGAEQTPLFADALVEGLLPGLTPAERGHSKLPMRRHFGTSITAEPIIRIQFRHVSTGILVKLDYNTTFEGTVRIASRVSCTRARNRRRELTLVGTARIWLAYIMTPKSSRQDKAWEISQLP